MTSHPPSSSVVPAWAHGTFIWKLCLADQPDALALARQTIAAVANQLDHAVDQVVFLTNAIGADEGKLPWDGVWPYWQRLSYRVGGGWAELSAFMVDMREQHRASISFHVNLTDVNPGLSLYPETRGYFERLRDAGAIYSRPEGINAQPWFGLPSVPQAMPEGRDVSDIIALVHYKKFWDSGMAREQIDGLFARLPYLPPLLYVDVLGPVGWCIHPGYPDGDLGGSLATQMEGIQNIIRYIRDCGCEVAGESPERLTQHANPPIRYTWGHGGLSRNDYGQIGAGWGTGAMARRGCKSMLVYGNQNSFHMQDGPAAPEAIRGTWEFPTRAPEVHGLRDWCNVQDMAQGFHFAVAPELYHIGCGAERLPGGPIWDRLDAAEGRVRLDALTLRHGNGLLTVLEAEDATLLGTVSTVADTWASGGKAVQELDLTLGNGVEFAFSAPDAGSIDVFIRYSSVGGGRLAYQLDDGPRVVLDLPDTQEWRFYGDHKITLTPGPGSHRLRLQHSRIYAAWSDGARAEWTLDTGFRAWHGEVELGRDGDRFCPVTWAEGRRILVYSRDGSDRGWTLPATWTGVKQAWFVPLTPDGRDEAAARVLPINGLRCKLTLQAGQSAVLVPHDED